jgi:RepB DNA-primase from phage plasmid
VPNNPVARYFLEEFEADDRLAVVLIHKRTESVIQRIASARQLASPESQVWLHDQNRMGYDVYSSPNSLREDARGRTKDDIATIRHIYLDFDQDGTAAVRRMRASGDMPEPSYLMNSSPGRWQAFWRVKDFSKSQAEDLQRGLAKGLGADPAATDCSRVMRVPGLYNHKYPRSHYIRIERLSDAVYAPEHFPRLEPDERGHPLSRGLLASRSRPPGRLSQSERDWAYARRALSRGESPEAVATAIARFRHGTKKDVWFYAELTVRKAIQSLEIPSRQGNSGPER